MIYLASPYSTDPETFYLQTVEHAVAFMREGRRIFSPILHWHDAAKLASLPTDAEFWWAYNRHMLSVSASFWVLCLPGWQLSKGVRMEIDWWKENRLGARRVKYVEPLA